MITKVLVSVGTHEQPFQRLLDGVRSAIHQFPNLLFVVQFGTGYWPTMANVESVRYFSHDDMTSHLHSADILISQASPGNVFGALEQETWPLVLGRRRELNEHVDNHQVDFAEAVDNLGLGKNVLQASNISAVLRDELEVPKANRVARCVRATADSERRASRFHKDFWANVNILAKVGDEKSQ
ncbi:glycosyltransferase [Pseudarthrobacter sp. lyk4-40-TYG-27]|uniref:glycosyltransferase n=1 Tax=Pseudarthrobacter sp. lyk4-40-TYG-27 TaxID=3040305 RepID=UPI002557872B|nr:glycosyltransferase [Pseudarthrobacter sp. lyk4-40-TYG-27]